MLLSYINLNLDCDMLKRGTIKQIKEAGIGPYLKKLAPKFTEHRNSRIAIRKLTLERVYLLLTYLT